MRDDPRQTAAQYRLERDQPADAAPADAAPADTRQRGSDPERGSSAAERAAFVENSIQQAIRRGEFDALPGAGKPLPGLGETHDPDWWIRRKIETEKLTGLGPPALTLRVESRQLPDLLDRLVREDDVRDAVDDFNRRVVEARRQLLGGPPVVTPLRDVEAEVAGWHERRTARFAAAADEAQSVPRRGRWRRRRG